MGLRTRLLLLVMVPIIPALVLAVRGNLELRRLESLRIQADASRLAQLAAADQRGTIDSARQHLAAMARLPEARGTNIATFDAFFANLLKVYTDYADFGLQETNGALVSSSFGHLPDPAFAEAPHVERLRRHKDFVIGQLRPGTASRKAGLVCAHPVFDTGGRLVRILFAVIDHETLHRTAANSQLPEGGVLQVFDDAGQLLAQRPPPAPGGSSASAVTDLLQFVKDRPSEVRMHTDTEGTTRLVTFTDIRGLGGPKLRVVVGIPVSAAFQEISAALIRNLLILAGVTLAAMLVARAYADSAILRPIRQVTRAAERLAQGDWNARTGMARVPADLREYVEAFDTMAESLQRQRLASLQSEEEIRRLNSSLEDRIAERTRQLEQSNRELESFSYSVSHDLRAPLRHIDGFVSMLQRDGTSTLSESGRRYLGVIADAAKRMGRLIDDLLEFSRMGRKDLEKEQFPMATVVDAALAELAGDIPPRAITWRIDPLPEVTADPALIKQVWLNLLSNAIKYTRLRADACIQIRCTQPLPNEFEFAVQDNGTGFDMKYVHKLFGVFQRLHRAEEFEGTGIGLANVRRIIVRHGGRVWAESAVDQGATFYFTLPRQTETSTPNVASAPAANHAAPPTPTIDPQPPSYG
ncbi:MAG: HAMP domain-containing protein [Verrucomicrobiales bacterium]|nr:HAMP domain-containing protein [Verrucomicrobiales bacterium]